MHATWLLRLLGAVVMTLGIAAAAQAQPTSGAGVVVGDAPMFLFPDATRTPLVTLPAGTLVRVLTREGDWLRVEYRDPYLGVRIGYMAASSVRIESAAAPPPPARGPTPGAVRPGTEPQTPPAPLPPPAPNPYDRGFVSVNAANQRESTAFTAATTFTQNVEQAHVATAYAGVHPILGDIAVGARLRGVLGTVVGVTWNSESTDATIVASIPHPFSFNNPRTVSGTVFGVRRQEQAVHVDASAIVTLGHAQVSAFAGPSVIRVKQGIVTNVAANEVYPYDTATFASASTLEVARAHIGYNAGVDGSVLLWKYFGVGAMVRYSRANVHFTPADGVDLTVRAGGLQAGGGVRFRF